MNRNRLPRWVNGAIDKIAESPMSLPGRIAAKRLGTPEHLGSVGVTTFDDRPTRVLIAPVNYSGQGRAWAAALEALDPTISARNMAFAVPGGFAFDADLEVPVSTYHNDPEWQQRQYAAALQATHVLIEAEEPPFGRMLGRSVVRQTSALLAGGVDVAYLAHGDDVRLPSRHRAHNEWSWYNDESVYLPREERAASRNIALLRESSRKLFVSTPDLLIDVPEAKWCPVVVDPARWAVADRAARDTGKPLRVVHAPSKPILKGTPLIMPTIEKLVSEGIIEFELLHGIPSSEMPARFARADVLLDQFRIGSYGVAACEAMAAGCLVVGQISNQVRQAVRKESGRELPIIEADPNTLENVLRELASDTRFDGQSADSIEFVRELHDGRRAAQVLRDTWLRPTFAS